MKINRILVGFDGSPPSHEAAQFAASLGRTVQARVSLVTVVEPLYPPVDTLPLKTWEEVTEGSRLHALAVLEEEQRKLKPLEAEVDTKVISGRPAQELAELSRAPDVDLVVVGTTGKSAVARILLGSVASKLVRLSTKPVLVVPLPENS